MSSTSPQRRTALPRFAEVAVAQARLAVVPRLRSRTPRVPFVTMVSLILLTGVVGLLLFNTSMQQASFTASRLEDQAANLSARQEGLAMELDQLRNPQRLAVAACKLGMVVGPGAAFLDLDSGALTGEPTPAEPAPCGLAPRRTPVAPPATRASTTGTGIGTGTGGGAGTATGASHAQPLRLGR